MSSNAPLIRRRFSRIFQRGAGTTEYILSLSLAVMAGSFTYKQYGPELRQHAAKMSERFATYYYEGWFWPEDDLATGVGSGTPRAGSGSGSNGSPSHGAPSSPGSSGGGNPLAGGHGSPGAGEGGSGSGGQTGNGSNPNTGTGGSNPFGNNGQAGGGGPFNNIGGNGGNPQMCSASPGSNSSTQSFAGNPIDIGTGNKLQLETDYIDSQPDGLPFIRSYNAYQGNTDIGIGHGWRHTWQREIRVTKDAVTVIRADGSHFVFSQAEAEYRAPVGVVDCLQHLDTGWQYITGFGAIERYDAAGRLQQITYPSGVSHTLHYDDNHTLTAVSDNRGARIAFGYDGDRLARITLPDGSNRLFTYDGVDRLSAVYRVSGSVLPKVSQWLNKPSARYRYEDERFPYALTALDDATHPAFAAWSYDHLGRAIRSQHGDGAEKIDINYVDDTTVVVTNAAGHNTTYTLEAIGDGRRRVVAIDGEAGLTCPALRQRNRYDANGFLTIAIDGGDRGRILERDARGLIKTEYDGVRIAPNGNWQPVESSTQIDRRWHAQWPLATHSLRHRYHDGQWLPVQQSTYAYDDHGSLREEIHTDLLAKAESAPATRRWTYTRHYHDAEQTRLVALHVSDPLGHNIQLTYDTDGRLTATRNALSQETRFTDHTPARLPGKVLLPNGLIVRLQYDDQQRLTRIQRGTGEQAEVTVIGYQANGLVNRLQLANGSAFELTYNSARQLIGVRNERGDTQTLEPSAVNGDWLTQTIADSNGASARKRHRSQDEWGRLIGWLGNSGQLTELAYDKAGDIVATHERNEDPADRSRVRTTQAQYDTLNRLTSLIDAAGYRTRLDYSPSGAIETVVDANGNTTRFERNGFGEVLTENNPARGDDNYRYDAAGNVIQRNQTAYRYDVLNRLTTIDAPGEQGDIGYVYDQTDAEHGNGLQQLTRIEAADHTIDYRYSAQGQLVAETTTQKSPRLTTTLQYDYLPGGRLSTITYPDGSVVQYRYDKERITDVTYTDAATDDETTLVEDITYAPFGGPQQWTYGNGLQQKMRTDLDGRVKAIELAKTGLSGDETLWSQRYSYDLYNNIERLDKDKASQQFTYDPVHRLIGEQRPGAAIEFDYDGVGNRLRETRAGTQTDYTYSKGNRLAQRSDVHIALDGRGNLIEQGDQRFEYNAQNRPTAVYRHQQLTARYGYNANGLRTHKTDYRNGRPITTQFAYAPDTRLLSAATTNHTTHYIWLGHTPIAQIEKSTQAKADQKTQITYLHPDHLLTPRVATNDEQKIIWRWDSDAFGGSKPEVDPDKDGKRTDIQLRFPGQYADEESGLYYNVFRYYDPQTGRYTQSDPIGLNGGLNSFAYVINNPTKYSDTLGLACDQRGCWVTPDERTLADAGRYSDYYNAACAAGDSYACMARQVATNQGVLAGVTNTRLANSIADNLPKGMTCAESRTEIEKRMEAIRVALAKAHVAALDNAGASSVNPRVLPRQTFSDFHNDIFEDNGAGNVFGGDIPVFGNWPFSWCSAPSCQP